MAKLLILLSNIIILLIFVREFHCGIVPRMVHGKYNEVIPVTLQAEQEFIYWFEPLKVSVRRN